MAEELGILDSTKLALGLVPDQTDFDPILIMHINSTFTTLQQLGVGPVEGYQIKSTADKWGDFTTEVTMNAVQSYMYLRVRLLFDPPQTSHAESAMKSLAQEAEWRLNVHAESPTKG